MVTCEIILYADDATIFTEGTTCTECYEEIGKVMNNINKWLKINKLILNDNKTN